MKKVRILGGFALVLAVAVVAVGLLAHFAQRGDGAFSGALARAREVQAAIDAGEKAVKNAVSVDKKAAAADAAILAAREALDGAAGDMDALDAVIATGATGDADIDALWAVAAKIQTGAGSAREAAPATATALLGALTGVDEGAKDLQAIVDEKVLALYQALAADAHAALSAAQTAVAGVREGAQKVFALVGGELLIDEIPLAEAPAPADIAACRAALDEISAGVSQMEALMPEMDSWAVQGDEVAAKASEVELSVEDRFVVMISDNFIGVMFTATLLCMVGLLMLFLSEPFKRQWAKNPVFSVFIALIVMLVFQTYALGFNHGSAGQWASFWFDNTFNVLRANTSVGMIALGMTLVIITGGIDLAVGSTLAGVGTVLMTMIDTGDHGLLIKFGITGYPAFAIGIVVALAMGALIGVCIGLLVTKGRIPPFIVTLGVMNVVRSVSQYFTKSYTPTVPKEFTAIANSMILGQRPMTIVYWLILAIIFYLIMKHTAFGRYVYAVGSNERTTRLSGINTDKVKLKVYVLTGLVVSIAAVSQLSRLGGMDVASAGTGYELDAIAAVVVGGTAMSGGRGSIVGTVLGVLIIGIMNNLLILLGVDSFLTDAFKGAIVVIAVLMQRKEKIA